MEILNNTRKDGINIYIDNTLLIIITMFIIIFGVFAFVFLRLIHMHSMVKRKINRNMYKSKKDEYIELT